ncbi:MAG: hypothetical protein AB7O56_11085 [Bauldia sp.]
MAARVKFGRRTITIPGNRATRTAIGAGLIPLGALGFLPVLGFWMIPAGLVILSADSPKVRRFNRRATVAGLRWWRNRKGGTPEGE